MWLHDRIFGMCQVLCAGITALAFRARVWGARGVPRRGAVVLAANHQSYLDPPLVGMYIRRTSHFLGRDTLFHSFFFGRLLRFFNGTPVKRGEGDVGAFKTSLRLLKRGQSLVMFPEATRTPDGRIHPVQPGVVALARKTNALIVPVALEGPFDLWPRTRPLPRFGPIWLEYGESIDPTAFDGLSVREAGAALTQELRRLHNRLRQRAGREPFEYSDDGLPAGRADDDASADRGPGNPVGRRVGRSAGFPGAAPSASAG
jgi:1-acyl-sn-glycerol-3-phosphate acyltransferase